MRAVGSEAPAPGTRPFDGALDGAAGLYGFRTVFERVVADVERADSQTRRALHELVCVVAARLHIERLVVLPALPAGAHRRTLHHRHRHLESLLARIDRRGPSDPDLARLFDELKTSLRAHLDDQDHTALAELRQRSGPGEQEALHQRVSDAAESAMTRPHPHLPRQGALGRVSRRLVSRLDRARNWAPVR